MLILKERKDREEEKQRDLVNSKKPLASTLSEDRKFKKHLRKADSDVSFNEKNKEK